MTPTRTSLLVQGTGSYLPPTELDNDEIERRAGDFDRDRAGSSLDDWLGARTGVRSRHRVAPGEGTTAMATEACRRALADAGVAASDVDLIVLTTFTGDYRLPVSVTEVQHRLDGCTARSLQIETACAGFIDGLAVAQGLMRQASYHTALVVHSDTMSAVTDPNRFLMQSMFGDGAGAVVLRVADDPGRGLLGIRTWTDGTKANWLSAGGGALSPRTDETVADGSHFLQIDTASVYDFAVEHMASSIDAVLADAGLARDDVDWVVAHQTGANIICAVAEQVGIPMDRFLMTLEHTGNTSGATIPVALDHWNRQGAFRQDDLLVMPTVGAGMHWGAALCRWHRDPAT
jgi:3-oxoacyl-[acyl-carrier-protein] synthase-3